MGRTLHERTLRRAVAYLGGAEELASFLEVEPAHVVSWLEGREPLPEQIFLRLVDIVLDPELSGAFAFRARLCERDQPAEERSSAGGTALQFRVGSSVARCPTCDCIDFVPVVPQAQPTNVAMVRCLFCGQELARGDLIVLAGKEAVQRSSAAIAALKQRQRRAAAGPAPRLQPKKTKT